MRILAALVLLLTTSRPPAAEAAPDTVTISVVGTSDLHGRIGALPWLAGYLGNLRAARARDGGAVVLLDAGDMFQGTLESNLAEGAPVVAAYNLLGYAAAALGNHEFDFGPAGPAPSPVAKGDDPRGALKARAAEANFPFLAANVVEASSRKVVAWPNVRPSTIVDAAGIKVGIVGVASAATGRSALPANVAGLDFLPLAKTVVGEAQRLRAQGAKVVIVLAHAGGACTSFAAPDSPESCDAGSEIFAVARALPKGSVDAIVAGHTHQGVAQRLAGVPIIQSYANGRAFGRVDLSIDRRSGKVLGAHVQSPREVCPAGAAPACAPGDYEGAPVLADEKVVALNAPAFAAARRKGEERLGVEVLRPLPHRRGEETALGNLLADLMLKARPGSDVAVLNSGSMRQGLPAGPLTYGSLYETFPFDNAFATLRVPAGYLARRLGESFARSGALVSLSGLRVRARCARGNLEVTLSRPDGSRIADFEPLVVTTSDFLATGGDGFFAGAKPKLETGVPIRDAMADVLRRRGGTLDRGDASLYDPKHPRIDLPGPVSVKCAL
jgi:2',3'-cyclic-nucleotide 2'-phosphodiesterase (5'-nucleotidase family)